METAKRTSGAGGGWGRIWLAAVKNWIKDDAFMHSAAVSFYSLFSLAPVSLGALTVAGLIFGAQQAQGEFSSQMTQLIGQNAAQMIEKAANASAPQGKGPLLTVVGIGVLLISATSVFVQLQESLNEIWGVTLRPDRSGWSALVGQRLLSFGMLLAVGFLLLISLVLSTALDAILRRAESFAVPGWSLWVGNGALSLGLVTVLFALLFKVLPDVKQHWASVWQGALLTSVLFGVGRLLIALYLRHSTLASIYGAAGSLIVLLLWIYYSTAILFFGAEFIRARHLERGVPVTTKSDAVLVRRELIENLEK